MFSNHSFYTFLFTFACLSSCVRVKESCLFKITGNVWERFNFGFNMSNNILSTVQTFHKLFLLTVNPSLTSL